MVDIYIRGISEKADSLYVGESMEVWSTLTTDLATKGDGVPAAWKQSI